MTEQNAESTTEDAGEDGESTDTRQEGDDLVAEVASHDEDLAGEVGELRDRIEELESELEAERERAEELESNLKRERADFQNYKKRMEERKEEIRERATEDLVERLLDVRDNLLRALDQDDDADLRDGVEATFSTFERVLEDEGVEPIEPEPGEAVDPNVHEVMMRVDGEREAGTIEEVFRPGYEMAGKVLRPAQVTVSEGSDDLREGEEAADSGERDDGSAGEEADGTATDE